MWLSPRDLFRATLGLRCRCEFGALLSRRLLPRDRLDLRLAASVEKLRKELSGEAFRGRGNHFRRAGDDELTTADGSHTIPQDCDNCHTFLVEESPTPPEFASR